jgi:lipoic acid synthetase
MSDQRLPEWVTNRRRDPDSIHEIKRMLRGKKLHTVCESAKCPNLGECFSRKTATFMILGNNCTRDCAFCAVDHDQPGPVDPEEPQRIMEAARELGLHHAVITSVTRDDLPDNGSRQFAACIDFLREEVDGTTIEVLTPDFQGDREAIQRVVEAGPDIYNHNLETVQRLYPKVRSSAHYQRSLDLLFHVKRCSPNLLTKSGIMVGLGEREDEVIALLRDLRDVGCDLVTIGQYLRPGKKNLAVQEYIPVEQFKRYEEIGTELGFQQVMSGPLVRSSFHAEEMLAS